MSETVEGDGYWWLPGKEDKKIAGHFKFDREEGGRLTLIGALSHWTDYAEVDVSEDGTTSQSLTMDVQDRSGSYPVIFGEMRGKAVTLIDSFQTHLSHGMFNVAGASQTVHVNRAFLGVWFGADEVPDGDGITATLAYLDDWALEQYIGETHQFEDEEGKKWKRIELSMGPLGTRSATLADGTEVRLSHNVGFGGRRSTKRHIWQGYYLRINTPEVMSVDDLIDIMSDFQDLVSIATGRNAAFKKIVGWHPDLVRKSSDDDTGAPRESFDILARWNLQDAAKKPDQIEPHDLYFSMDDLGGIAGVASWMEAAATHRSTLGRTMSTRSSTSMFVSDRLLNYAAALEGFDRRKTGNDRHKLPTRLQRLARQAGQPFTELVEKPNKWADALVWHRNDIAHHLGRQARGAATDQYYLAESAYWLAVFLMLREANAPDAVFTRILESQRFLYLSPKVQAVVAAHGKAPKD